MFNSRFYPIQLYLIRQADGTGRYVLERHFGWIRLAVTAMGLAITLASLVIGLNGWEISRLWLNLLGGAMIILAGAQLIIYWILMMGCKSLARAACTPG